jgi:hypothetical protein
MKKFFVFVDENKKFNNPQHIQPKLIQPQTIQPQTIQPQTIQPQTIQPQTIQPQTIQPQLIHQQPQTIQPQLIQQESKTQELLEKEKFNRRDISKLKLFEDEKDEKEKIISLNLICNKCNKVYKKVKPFKNHCAVCTGPKDSKILKKNFKANIGPLHEILKKSIGNRKFKDNKQVCNSICGIVVK